MTPTLGTGAGTAHCTAVHMQRQLGRGCFSELWRASRESTAKCCGELTASELHGEGWGIGKVSWPSGETLE